MAPSTVYTRASTGLVSSFNPLVLRSLASSNIRRQTHVPSRSLWWWSRHGTWSSTNDENTEERIQRHHKIMRHRYSRALRRRAMWERDDHVSAWLCRTPEARFDRRWGMYRTMSSTDPRRGRLDEKRDDPNHQEFWTKTKKDFEKFDQDFESFKAAVDRAVERDPYGTIFGRRLQSPITQNQSSWISWLFNRDGPAQQKTDLPSATSSKRKIEIEVIGKKDVPVKSSHSTAPKVSRSVPAQLQSAAELEYVYDPVSGRKVPKSIEKKEQLEQPKQTFLETLFSEHGSTPDKPTKQHRVYGYDPETSKQTTGFTEPKPEQAYNSRKFSESSRRREYQQLRASAIGNSIDTTSEFGGKYEAEPSVEREDVDKKVRRVPEPMEDVPLFSGTTYESRSSRVAPSAAAQVASWLEREGFQTTNVAQDETVQPSSDPKPRLQPSLDRMQNGSEASRERKFISKLQPAIDRIQVSRPKESSQSVLQQLDVTSGVEVEHASTVTTKRQPESSRNEDIDLLRASDVRAAIKVTRTTKQEAEQAKTEKRNQLENNFDQIQKQQPEDFVSDAATLRADASKLSRNIDRVWKHAEKYPHGFVAQAMDSLGMSYKQYEKPYTSNQIDLTKRLEFSEDSLQKLPSIYRNDTRKPLLKSAESTRAVKAEEKARIDLTESLRSSSKQALAMKQKNDAQIEQLAEDICQIYETEHGPIDLSLNHDLMQKAVTSESGSVQKPEPKMSMQTSPDFFAARAQFLTEVDQVADGVKSVKAKTALLQAAMEGKAVTESEASQSVKKLTDEAEFYLENVNSLHEKFDKQQKVSHPLSTATVKPGVPRHPEIERHIQVFEPQLIELREQTKAITKRYQDVDTAVRDLGKGSVGIKKLSYGVKGTLQDSVTAKIDTPASPYLLLVYNRATCEVDQTAMERLPWSPTEKPEKANPIKIMGDLNYPAAFVTHFVELEKAGYELSSGGGDVLIFRLTSASTKSGPGITAPVATPSKVLRDNVAAEEASLQPEITETIAQPKDIASKHTATVLDDIPVEIPPPGPSAPTAPSAANPIKRVPRSGPKVRRQEHVFSGTIPVRTAPAKSQRSTKDNRSAKEDDNAGSDEPNDSFFARTTRTVKRGLVGVAAFGAAAYTIGVVAEGIGAQAQVEGDAAIGPRRKVVMPVGQRAGIYSTESSRIE